MSALLLPLLALAIGIVWLHWRSRYP